MTLCKQNTMFLCLTEFFEIKWNLLTVYKKWAHTCLKMSLEIIDLIYIYIYK